MGCGMSKPSGAGGTGAASLKSEQGQASRAAANSASLSGKGGADKSLPPSAAEPHHEMPVPAQVSESQAPGNQSYAQDKSGTGSGLAVAARKSSLSSTGSRTTTVRPPWGATPSAAAASLRRRDPSEALRQSDPTADSPSTRTEYASSPTGLGSPEGASARRSQRRTTSPDVGEGEHSGRTPRYMQNTETASAKTSRTPKDSAISADKRQPWGIRKAAKRTLDYNSEAALADSTPAAELPHTSVAPERASPPNVVLSSSVTPDIAPEPVNEPATVLAVTNHLGASKVQAVAKAGPAVVAPVSVPATPEVAVKEAEVAPEVAKVAVNEAAVEVPAAAEKLAVSEPVPAGNLEGSIAVMSNEALVAAEKAPAVLPSAPVAAVAQTLGKTASESTGALTQVVESSVAVPSA